MYNLKTTTYKKTIYKNSILIKKSSFNKISAANKYNLKRGAYYIPERVTTTNNNFLYK